MRGRALVRLHDILREIEGIRQLTASLTFAEFDASWPVLRATQHALLTVEEAVKNVSEDMTGRRPDIPWGRISALGNFLRHEYAAIDNVRLWDVGQNHLGALEGAVRDVLRGE